MKRLKAWMKQDPKAGVTAALRRIVGGEPVASPTPSTAMTTSAQATYPATPDDQVVMRDRARRALLDARQAMGGLLGGAANGEVTAMAVTTTVVESTALEPLRVALIKADEERSRMQAEIMQLRAELASLSERFAKLESRPAEKSDGALRLTEAVPDTGDSSAAVDSSPAADSLQPVKPTIGAKAASATSALQQRIFPAGTIGTRVVLRPAPSESELQDILDRLNADPAIEHAEALESRNGAVTLRLTLRLAMKWDQFGPMLNRALGNDLIHGNVGWSEGAISLRPAATGT